MSGKKKEVVQKEMVAKAVVHEEEQMTLPLPSVDVELDAKKAIVHDDEVAAIKDSRKRDLLLFKAVEGDCGMWIVAVSEHQAKLAFVDRVWPLAKWSKKDRDLRYLNLLESAAEKVGE